MHVYGEGGGVAGEGCVFGKLKCLFKTSRLSWVYAESYYLSKCIICSVTWKGKEMRAVNKNTSPRFGQRSHLIHTTGRYHFPQSEPPPH